MIDPSPRHGCGPSHAIVIRDRVLPEFLDSFFVRDDDDDDDGDDDDDDDGDDDDGRRRRGRRRSRQSSNRPIVNRRRWSEIRHEQRAGELLQQVAPAATGARRPRAVVVDDVDRG